MAVVGKMVQRFPFNDKTLTDMAVMNPAQEIRDTCHVSSGIALSCYCCRFYSTCYNNDILDSTVWPI